MPTLTTNDQHMQVAAWLSFKFLSDLQVSWKLSLTCFHDAATTDADSTNRKHKGITNTFITSIEACLRQLKDENPIADPVAYLDETEFIE